MTVAEKAAYLRQYQRDLREWETARGLRAAAGNGGQVRCAFRRNVADPPEAADSPC